MQKERRKVVCGHADDQYLVGWVFIQVCFGFAGIFLFRDSQKLLVNREDCRIEPSKTGLRERKVIVTEFLIAEK